MKHSEIVFNAHATVEKDGDWYLAYCPPLDLFSQGKTEKKALANIEEAVKMFFESCIERGTLSQALKECGWAEESDKPRPAKTKGHEINVRIPLIFSAEMDKNRDSRKKCLV